MQLLKKVIEASPLLWPFKPSGLYAFNYHRIGDPAKSSFDPNVFSCDEETFDSHIRFFNKHFDVIDIDELCQLVHSGDKITDKLALITFDDGYLDNYEKAFPILKKYNTPAAFFIATDFIDMDILPWWDEIAYIIKHIDVNNVQLPDWPKSVNLAGLTEANKIKAVLRLIKADESLPMNIKIEQLKHAVNWQPEHCAPKETLFMSWTQIKDMKDNRMSIGSQSCSHRIMSHLDEEQQREEIINSKLRLEAELGTTIDSFAYPVGSENSFNDTTKTLLQQAGYKVAFNFLPDINLQITDRFNIFRFSVDNNCSVKALKRRINETTLKKLR